MNKLVYALLFVFCMSIPFAFAAIEMVDVTPVKDTILQKQEASFNITIHNTRFSEESFALFSDDTEWIVRQEPLFTSLLPNETRRFTLYLTPKVGTSTGPKGIELTLRASSNQNPIVRPIYVYLSSGEVPALDYNPSVKILARINTDNTVDPRDSVVIKVQLKNRNPLDIKNLDVVLSSNNINTVRSIALGPFEETTEYFEIRVNPNLPPQKDILVVLLKRDNKTFDYENVPYEVISYSPFFKKETTEKDSFLRTDTSVLLFNIGNIEKEEEYKIPTDWFTRFFSSTTPDAQLRRDGKVLYQVWKVNLEPQDSYRIDYSINFRPIFYFGLSLLIVLVLYFIFRSPIVVRKEVYKVQQREGGLYELKVILYIKNRSRRVVSNLQISDRISHLSEVIRDSYLGSLKPDKLVREENKGTYIKWLIPNIESLEERIITYKIRSKFSILGRLSLAGARVKFITKSGHVRVCSSNPVSVEA